MERLARGERVLVAEGYIFELERRGYLRAGAFVPEVILEHPDVVKGLYEEFVHAGSDVVVALQVRLVCFLNPTMAYFETYILPLHLRST